VSIIGNACTNNSVLVVGGAGGVTSVWAQSEHR